MQVKYVRGLNQLVSNTLIWGVLAGDLEGRATKLVCLNDTDL